MKKERRKIWIRIAVNLGFPLLCVALLITVYAVAAAVVGENLILPSLGKVISAMGELLSSSEFYKSLGFTLLRSLVAFAAAFVIGGALGVGATYCKPLEKALMPFLVFLRAIPTISVIFLLVLWVRSTFTPSIIAFTVLMPMSYTQVKTALGSLDKGLFEMSKVYGVPKSRMWTKFVLPQIAPPLIEHAAGNLSFAVKLVVAGEALAVSASGLGGMLNLSNIYLETARLMAVTLLAVAVCFLLEGGVRLLNLTSRRWR